MKHLKFSAALLTAALLCLGAAALAEEDYEEPSLSLVTAVNDQVTSNGDLQADVEDSHIYGIMVQATDGKTAKADATGDITVSAVTDKVDHLVAEGADVYAAGSGSTAILKLTGSISATGQVTVPMNTDAAGLNLYAEEGSAIIVETNGDTIHSNAVRPDDDGYTWSAAVSAYSVDSSLQLLANSNLHGEADDYGIGLNTYVLGDQPATSDITVNGDVYGSLFGIVAANSNPQGDMKILVNGTISGGSCSVVLNDSTLDRITLTAWEIKEDENGAIINGRDDYEQPVIAPELEKQVNYILRIDPKQVNIITPEGATLVDGLYTAHQDDEVTVKVNAGDRRVTAAYGDVKKSVRLKKNADGDYILTVPRGGGVYLSVKLSPAGNGPYTITIEPNGGSVKGHSDAWQVKNYTGTKYQLPDTETGKLTRLVSRCPGRRRGKRRPARSRRGCCDPQRRGFRRPLGRSR